MAANRYANAGPKPAPVPDAPEAVDCTDVVICNDDITCTQGQAQPDTANTLPIYPKPADLP